MKNIIFTAVVLASTALVGCKVDVPQNRPAADISGVAADNIIRNGEVRVYAWNGSEREILLSTKTDNYGYYVDPLQAESQFIKICVVGGEYTEEASSVNIRLENGDRMCAITYWESGQAQETMVTPETNMAAALMEYEVKSGKGNLQNIVSNANSKIGTLFGYDILTTKPADMTSDDLAYTGLNDSVRSGLWHAAFSRIALNAAKANGQSTHTSLISSMALHKAIYRDLSADGKLDGWGVAENGKSKVRLGLGSFELDANVYRTELAKELVNFVKSDRNKTAVKVNDVLSYATTHSITTDSIFNDKDIPKAFDEDAPTIVFDTAENTYISGTYTLGLKVTDFSGVKAVTYRFNDGSEQNFDFTQESLVFDTKQFNNGELELAVTAIDKLDNTVTLRRVFNVSNAKPVLNLESKTLVNSTDYSFKAILGEVKAGVAAVYVNGREANFSENEISSNLRLSQGENTIPVKLVDNTGAEYSYSWKIDVDTLKPSIEFSSVDWKVLLKKGESVVEGYLSAKMDSDIFITPRFFKLNGLAVNEATLRSIQWPTLKLKVSDNVNSRNTYKSETKDLNVRIEFRESASKIVHKGSPRTLKPSEDGFLIIPLSEELLGEGWYQKEDKSEIVVFVSDEAGNNETFVWALPLAVSKPSVSPVLSQDVYLQGGHAIALNGKDLRGSDYISITLNGSDTQVLHWEDAFYTLPANLPDGQHWIRATVKTNGETLSEQEFYFNVDNTPPSITVDSKLLVSERAYVLKGNTNDGNGSGIYSAEITHNGLSKPIYSLAGGFTQEVPLKSGDNDFTITAIDYAQNKAFKDFIVLLDDVAPKFNPNFADGRIEGSYSGELYNTSFDVKFGVSHEPLLKPMEFNRNALPYHLDSSTSNLSNVTLSEVNGIPDTITNDGSLNIEHPNAANYLRNQKIPHLDFTVSDSHYSSNDNAGVISNLDNVKAYLTVTFSNQTEKVVNRKQLQMVQSATSREFNRYLVPFTVELFTDKLLEVKETDTITALIEAVDEAGNVTAKSYEFKVFIAPETNVKPTFTGGVNRGGIGNTGLEIKNLVVESNAGLSRVILTDKTEPRNNYIWDSLNSADGKVTSIKVDNKSATKDGVYQWELTAYDLAGNILTKEFSGVIDKTSPVVAITSNVPSPVTAAFTLNWKASDNYGLSKVEVFDGIKTHNVNAGDGSIVITPSGADGNKTLWIKATDKAGNIHVVEKSMSWQHNDFLVSVDKVDFYNEHDIKMTNIRLKTNIESVVVYNNIDVTMRTISSCSQYTPTITSNANGTEFQITIPFLGSIPTNTKQCSKIRKSGEIVLKSKISGKTYTYTHYDYARDIRK